MSLVLELRQICIRIFIYLIDYLFMVFVFLWDNVSILSLVAYDEILPGVLHRLHFGFAVEHQKVSNIFFLLAEMQF